MTIVYSGDVVMSGGTEESPPDPTHYIPKETTDMISIRRPISIADFITLAVFSTIG